MIAGGDDTIKQHSLNEFNLKSRFAVSITHKKYNNIALSFLYCVSNRAGILPLLIQASELLW